MSMHKPRFFITDVFTGRKYGGNQLATFVDCESLSDQEMQQIAKEINFSETTFITSRQPVDGAYAVRIFTPNAEVDFAGHPTLGTAYIIREKLRLTTANEIALNLRIGRIPVTFSEQPGQAPMLWMRQVPPTFGNQLDPNVLARILGLSTADIVPSLPVEEVSTGFPTIVVPLANGASLKRIKIDKAAYFALANDAWAKLILAFSPDGYEAAQDLSVRVFVEYYGIPEDAATGSSNGALAAYLVRHKLFGGSQVDVRVGQGYELGRPSDLALRASETHGEIEVFVGGSVVEVAEGVWG